MRIRYLMLWLVLLTVVNLIIITDCYMTLRRVDAANESIENNIGKIVKVLHWEMTQINKQK